MERPTQTVTTPIGQHEVVIKEWLTGREREYVSEPLYKSVTPKVGMKGEDIDFGAMDVGGFMTESAHREIESYVASVDGNTEKVLDAVLDMHEDDMKFVRDEIARISKKKETSGT